MWTSKLLKLAVAVCFVGSSTVFAQDLEDTQTPLPSGDDPAAAAPANATPAHDPAMDDSYGPSADMGEAVDDAMSEDEIKKNQTPEPQVMESYNNPPEQSEDPAPKKEKKAKKAPAKHVAKKVPAKAKATAKKDSKKKKAATAKNDKKAKPAKTAKAKAKAKPARAVASTKKSKMPAHKKNPAKKKKPKHTES